MKNIYRNNNIGLQSSLYSGVGTYDKNNLRNYQSSFQEIIYLYSNYAHCCFLFSNIVIYLSNRVVVDTVLSIYNTAKPIVIINNSTIYL